MNIIRFADSDGHDSSHAADDSSEELGHALGSDLVGF